MCVLRLRSAGRPPTQPPTSSGPRSCKHLRASLALWQLSPLVPAMPDSPASAAAGVRRLHSCFQVLRSERCSARLELAFVVAAPMVWVVGHQRLYYRLVSCCLIITSRMGICDVSNTLWLLLGLCQSFQLSCALQTGPVSAAAALQMEAVAIDTTGGNPISCCLGCITPCC